MIEYVYKHPMPAVAADVVLIAVPGLDRFWKTKIVHGAKILLIQRQNDPFKDKFALPGGYVNIDEWPDDAAARELGEETNIQIAPDMLHDIRTYADPKRDPRGRVVSFAYWAMLDESDVQSQMQAKDDAKSVSLVPIGDIHTWDLAFDHAKIIGDALAMTNFCFITAMQST